MGNDIPSRIYDQIMYCEGYAIVKKNNKWGALDDENNEILPLTYDDEMKVVESLLN